MKLLRRRSGFTLVEIMIVVLIIGILLAIAVPNFMQARDSSRSKSCIDNLRHIADAKEQCAMDLKLADTDTPLQSDLTPTYIKAWPVEPQGGAYTINNLSTSPTCSVGGTHVLP